MNKWPRLEGGGKSNNQSNNRYLILFCFLLHLQLQSLRALSVKTIKSGQATPLLRFPSLAHARQLDELQWCGGVVWSSLIEPLSCIPQLSLNLQAPSPGMNSVSQKTRHQEPLS